MSRYAKCYRDGIRLGRWGFRVSWRWLHGVGVGIEWEPGPVGGGWTFSRLRVRLLVVLLTIEHVTTWVKLPDPALHPHDV